MNRDIMLRWSEMTSAGASVALDLAGIIPSPATMQSIREAVLVPQAPPW